jgi:hypothetical protein
MRYLVVCLRGFEGAVRINRLRLRASEPDVKWPGRFQSDDHRLNQTQPKLDSPEQLVLFIDHPGMGWHNKNEAGIDRRGTNAALNAILVLAKRALADLETVAGNHAAARELRADANHLSALITGTFFDTRRALFVDGVLEGQPHSQISEQTNTLAIAAGCCGDETARSILVRLLQSTDTTIARSGPYFWAYLFPELRRLGLYKLALDRTRALWGRMVESGATALWETFLGDDLDTWCRPWAGAPLEFLLTGILGLPGINVHGSPIILRPRYDLLAKAEGSIFMRHGLFSIGWIRSAETIHLRGFCPAGVTIKVHAPDGEVLISTEGDWEITRKLA